MTYLAFNFCNLDWWLVLLSWLLPFLLGLLLGYAIWARYKKMKENLEEEVKKLKSKISELEAELADCRHHHTELDSEIAMLKGQLRERDLQVSTLESSLAAANKKGGSKEAVGVVGAAAGLTSSGQGKVDDLKKIEGIGPKIEKLLNEENIHSYDDLATAKVKKLRKILDAAGPKYQITKPDTWPEQAALARDGNWDELEKLQNVLVGGVRPGDQKGSAAASDDLKIVEGIGPKIEALLNEESIWTFAELAKTDVSRLKEILDGAGPRYRISTPDTWPEQAALARDGKWDALDELQNNIKGGRKT
ncbi:helix-hairpin-helix domain-containing protein [Portibacter marinus]|uniref:helix-hairpin-helix domain-containing protein n=1 Tax=Portibacter marinus TaxID=2898660 RepID=UPI001F399E95|nr:helix-hairpin-helix domain-containing protein [Portibacter marinus]